MKPEVSIRIAGSEDTALLAKLGRETFHDAFVNHPQMPQKDLKFYLEKAFAILQIATEINDPKAIFLLAEIDGETAGYAKLECGVTTSSVEAKNPIKLKRLYSKQRFIGFGVGASLMKHCLEEALKRTHDAIWLTVWENNLHAQTFYKRWDFEQCGTIEFLLGEAMLTDILMKRAIVVPAPKGFRGCLR